MGRPRKRMIREPTDSGQAQKKRKRKSQETKEEPTLEADLLLAAKKTQRAKRDSELSLYGNPIPPAEALQKWPLRYQSKVLFLISFCGFCFFANGLVIIVLFFCFWLQNKGNVREICNG